MDSTTYLVLMNHISSFNVIWNADLEIQTNTNCSCLNEIYDAIFVISIASRAKTLSITLYQLNNEKIEYILWEGHSSQNNYSKQLWHEFKYKADLHMTELGCVSKNVSIQICKDMYYGEKNARGSVYTKSKIFYLRLTQIDILKYSKKMKFENILLLEDDIVLADPYWFNLFCKLEKYLPEWYVLNLGINQISPEKYLHYFPLIENKSNNSIHSKMTAEMKYYKKNVLSYGTFGISFSYKMYSILIDLFDKTINFHPIDNLNLFKEHVNRTILNKCFGIHPNLILPNVHESDIHRKRSQIAYVLEHTTDKNFSHFSKYWRLRWSKVNYLMDSGANVSITDLVHDVKSIDFRYVNVEKVDFTKYIRNSPSQQYLSPVKPLDTLQT